MFKATLEYVISPKKSTYNNDDYIIAKCRTSTENVPANMRNGKPTITFTAKGKGIPTNKKFDIAVNGKWRFSEKYGLELFVESSDIVPPSDEVGIINYLSSFLNGCGKVTAKRIYDRFGQATLLVLNSDPEKLLEVGGIRKKQLERMLSSYTSTRKYQELTTLLSPFGVSKKQIEKINAIYGNEAISKIKDNPFVLQNIRGFNFDLLDTISQRLNCDPSHPARIECAIKQVIHMAAIGNLMFDDNRLRSGGNLYVDQYILRSTTLKLLNQRTDSTVSEKEVTSVIWTMYINHSLLGENGNVYLPIDYDNEQKTAGYIVEMLNESKVKRYSDDVIAQALKEAEEHFGFSLSENQIEGVKKVLKNPISIITGGAGTGKTTVLKFVLYCLNKLEKDTDVLLAAPTGKAAVRMTESTGKAASTIHKALGLMKDDYFDKEEDIETLNYGFIVCDEFSMADMFIAYRLFAALNLRETRVLLLGDIGQLPSVGAGRVLNDLIECGKIPTIQLNVIFRQAQESNIVRNSHNIYEGVHYLDFSKDFLCSEYNSSEECAERTVDVFVQEVAKYGIDDVTVLSPVKNKGNCSTKELNSRIQARINPLTSQKSEHHFYGTLFREDDKVIQLRNREAETERGESVDICNGDTGFLRSIIPVPDGGYKCRIEFSGGRTVIFDEDDMLSVQLAYAITVHKSQGSEYSSVVLPLLTYMPKTLMTRNLLYTGVTRAKKQINCIVDNKKVFSNAINNNVANLRNSALATKIVKKMEEY